MYKMEVYTLQNDNLHLSQKSNNLSYFDRYKNRKNYRIKIYKRGRKWELIYNECE